ncbi:TonB family protein [Pseudodonghicola sp.]|uniref:TonB family protein n=1 Tax=Pseudodonghicola sp. TaxID=1969463 RepID=UPI003A970F55
MRLLINATVFLAAALTAHLAVAALHLPQEGAASAGDGGEAVMSAEASSADIAAMVEDWERPPEVAADLDLTAPKPPQMTAPEPPALAALPRPERPARPELTPAMPAAPTPPDRIVEAPQPPEPPVQQQEPEPEPEPKVAKVEPKPKAPAAAQTSSRAERAAGTGGGVNAGDAQSSAPSTLSTSRAQSLQTRWGASIRARIERRKRVPRGGGDGTVILTVSVAPSGELLGVSIHKSSGRSELDQAALAAVQAAGRFASAPKGLSDGRYTFSLPIRFAG